MITDRTLVLAPRLLAPLSYYRLMARYDAAVIDTSLPFDKRLKSVHRYDIVDTRGALSLTVPISHGSERRPRWSDITVSTHGQWWNVHRVTLESAYGRTPFFEYYRDLFAPLFDADRYTGATPARITDIATEFDAVIRSILNVRTRLSVTIPENAQLDIATSPKDFDALTAQTIEPYHQIRAAALGFVPNLSAIDAIFNLGPEAARLIH